MRLHHYRQKLACTWWQPPTSVNISVDKLSFGLVAQASEKMSSQPKQLYISIIRSSPPDTCYTYASSSYPKSSQSWDTIGPWWYRGIFDRNSSQISRRRAMQASQLLSHSGSCMSSGST